MQVGTLHWLRGVLVLAFVAFAAGAGWFSYRYVNRPITLTVAAGSLLDGADVKLMSAISGQLASTNASVRLKVDASDTSSEAARKFADGKVDLAVVRADADNLTDARTVVVIAQAIVLIVVPPGSSIDDIDGLKGKTIGVGGGGANHRVVEALTEKYELSKWKIQFKDVTLADARHAIQSKQVSALLMVMPITQEYLALLRNIFPAKGKDGPRLVSIESAGAIASVIKAFESYELPKGTLRASPPVPDEDMTTLQLPIYLVANKNLDDGVIGDLAKAIMDARPLLRAENPLVAEIAAPSTDKDANIPIHPGAGAFFDGTQKDFLDKYGNALLIGPLLGVLASLLAAAWKFTRGRSGEKPADDPLYMLYRRIRAAETEKEFIAIQREIDNILTAELAKHEIGKSDAMTAAALGLATQRLEHLIEDRRRMLQNRVSPAAVA